MSNYTYESEKLWCSSRLPWILLRIPAVIKPGGGGLKSMMERGAYRPPAEDRTYQSIRLERLAEAAAAAAEHGVPQSVYNLTPPKVRSHVRAAKAAARELGLSFDWPEEAGLERHTMIRSIRLHELGIELSEADG